MPHGMQKTVHYNRKEYKRKKRKNRLTIQKETGIIQHVLKRTALTEDRLKESAILENDIEKNEERKETVRFRNE